LEKNLEQEKPFEENWFHAPIHGIGGKALLSAEESHHLRKVLRVRMGRSVVVSNGEGGVYRCATRERGDAVELEAEELLKLEPEPPRLNLALSLLKGRDLEEPVEGLCQLAVNAIHLVTTDHTQEFKGQDHGKLVERLRAKSLVGLKQAKKPWLTQVHAPMPIRSFREKHTSLELILLELGEDRLPSVFPGPFALVTGPEGGLSAAETAWLLDSGCHRMGLGSTRLRGTHAPLLACGKLMGLGLI
jgi:16S rRNA (uracil1498-N3)-methyltransferase